MLSHVPRLPFSLDPLIAEAKRRARARRIMLVLATTALIAVAVPVGTFVLPPSGGALGVCAAPPQGWRKRTVAHTALSPGAVMLTNFRFGQMHDFYGLTSRQHWPHNGVLVAVVNEGPDATPRFSRALRVEGADFNAFEGAKFPVAERAVRSGGRVLNAYVEVRSVTPATIAAANQALAAVHPCQA